MQAGALGLLRAIDAYKPEAATTFESYAILRNPAAPSSMRSVPLTRPVGPAAKPPVPSRPPFATCSMNWAARRRNLRSPPGSVCPVARYRERLQAASS